MKKLFCIILLLLLLTANVGQAQFSDSESMFGQLLNLGHWSTDGLVFYWRGIPAGKVIDESLNRNHGTITGATWVGDGLSFDGNVGTYVGLPSAIGSLLASSNAATLIAWARPNNTGQDQRMMGAYGIAGTERQIFVWMDIGGAGVSWAAGVKTATGGGNIGEDATGTVSITKIQQVVVTWSPSQVLSLYVNGEFITSSSFADDLNDPTNSYRIGSIETLDGFDGNVSDVSIYNRALSASEIAALYLKPNIPMQQDPIWLLYSPTVPSGIIPIIQAHTRRRAG